MINFALIIVVSIFFIITGISMAIVRWGFKIHQPLYLLLVAVVVGVGIGGFLAQAGSAMASSVNPRLAFLNGAWKGALMCTVSSGLWFFIFSLIRNLCK